MTDFGEFVALLLGIWALITCVRVSWIMALPIAMQLSKRWPCEDMEWHRGTAKGRPPVRYIKDGWGRVVYVELDPEAPDEGGAE